MVPLYIEYFNLMLK